MEKGLLLAAVVFLAAVVGVVMLRESQRPDRIDVERMYVPREMVVERTGAVPDYRLKGGYNPFQERAAARELAVKITLPDPVPAPVVPPPAFWQKEEF